jgi:hypothetical protein
VTAGLIDVESGDTAEPERVEVGKVVVSGSFALSDFVRAMATDNQGSRGQFGTPLRVRQACQSKLERQPAAVESPALITPDLSSH